MINNYLTLGNYNLMKINLCVEKIFISTQMIFSPRMNLWRLLNSSVFFSFFLFFSFLCAADSRQSVKCLAVVTARWESPERLFNLTPVPEPQLQEVSWFYVLLHWAVPLPVSTCWAVNSSSERLHWAYDRTRPRKGFQDRKKNPFQKWLDLFLKQLCKWKWFF